MASLRGFPKLVIALATCASIPGCPADPGQAGSGSASGGATGISATGFGESTGAGTDDVGDPSDPSAGGGSGTGGSDTADGPGGDDAGSDGSGSDGSGSDGSGSDGSGSDGSGSDGGIACQGDADCDDLQFCNGTETCGAGGFCLTGTAPDCADAVDCTVDACDEVADACVSVADNAACDDKSFCNGSEVCDPFTGCQTGTPPACDDGLDCTSDACDDLASACVFVPDDTACQDPEFCNGAEVCDPVVGCQAAAAPTDCDDLTACTTDTCDENADVCVNTPSDDTCQNGEFCDGVETCVSGLGCVPGSVVDCGDDGIACTREQCNETSDACEVQLDNDTCAMEGLDFCTDSGCVAGEPCSEDADCDDGLGCNGIETCDLSTIPGVCRPGTVVGCNDGVSCTADVCQEIGSNATACTNTPSDGACNDGDPCNGVETCDAVADCLGGTPPDCDDGVTCTDDFCSPAAGGCLHAPEDVLCADGSYCNGQETCDPTLDCQPADTPVACPDDGIPCTSEVCDDTLATCVTTKDDSVCDCGDHCDPTAPGADVNGCTDECSVALCDGALWQCGNCIDDDGDCSVDSADLNCFGVCDNNEAGLNGDIPGQNAAPCKMDCYFDDDSGSGNDDCYWSHACDPFEPQADSCACTPDAGEMLCDANIPGYNGTCDEAWATQSTECLDVCGPVTPNGCDCFGCCEVTLPDATQTTIYLGSEDPDGTPSCGIEVIDDPNLCKPCTQVAACLNPCENCELCFGETTLPPECGEVPECSGRQQACGQPGLDPCPAGMFCLTGCCSEF